MPAYTLDLYKYGYKTDVQIVYRLISAGGTQYIITKPCSILKVNQTLKANTVVGKGYKENIYNMFTDDLCFPPK